MFVHMQTQTTGLAPTRPYTVCMHHHRPPGVHTQAQQGVMLHEGPAVVVQTVALVDQELADVTGRHFGQDLKNFPCSILAPDLHYLGSGQRATEIERR